MKQNVICIAGAHRSGTSMLARLLHCGGLDLGPESDLMPAASDNPDGFWENLRFVGLNDEILNAVGAAWDLPPWQDEAFDAANLEPTRAKAQLLIDDFREKATWAWKDPRNCLTMRFWTSVFVGLKTVVIVRNPLEVAYSMHKRNGTSYALGLRLWEIYNRRLLASTHRDERIIVRYQDFFEEPQSNLEKIAGFAGLDVPQTVAAAALVAVDRRHTNFTIEQMIDAGVSRQIVALYQSLLEGSAPGGGKKKKATRRPAIGNDQLSGTENKLNTRIPDGEDARRELATRRGDEIRHREEIARYQRTIEKLREELAAKSVKAAAEINQRDGRIEELQKAYAHLDQLLERELSQRQPLLAELERARQQLERARQQLEDVRQGSARDAAEITDLRERFTQTNQLLQRISTRLADFEARNASLTDRLRKQLSETKRLLRLLDQIGEAADLLRKSRRWKLANPVAALNAILSGKPLPGFGHLDKNVEKYRSWLTSHPEALHLEEDIQELRPREIISSSMPPADRPAMPAEPLIPTREIEFAETSQPEVSIIIPVFNQSRYTLACLAAVQEHSGGLAYEVIVVDDHSTDNTQEVVTRLPGLVYLRAEANAGFIASCNRGAEAARGRFLVFLNNDTTVTEGWLSALRQTFEDEPQAGLVGSKLIYPDGRLQEAGGIIWRDGSGWNRGKFQDAATPEYNYLREVDYCSAASVMIPKALFDRLGGFDTKYAPAYYEDTDLAFKVAAAGRRVLYQPLSVVVHYEGVTGGTDISAGTKKYQEINRATLTDSWASVLAQKPENGDVAAWDKPPNDAQRILVIDHHLPMPDRDSGSLRMFQILTILQQLGHRVTFLPDNLADIPPYGDNLRKRGIEVVHHPYASKIADYLRAAGEKFDVIILSRCDFARKHIENVRQFAPQSRVIFDTVDLHFLRTHREARLTQDAQIKEEAKEKEAAEYELIDRADETWVVSTAEEELLRRERPAKPIHVVSNIVDIPGSATPFAHRRDFLFIGSFQHTPNIDAALFFTREIYPLVRAELPGARFYIIGDKAPPSVIALADENVIVTGLQPDVRPYFDNVKLSVAPLRYGAGVKGKINQSMAFGVPVVATSLAVEGMGLSDREDVLIADEPADFARTLVELYNTPALWEQISQAGIRKTEESFSRKTAERQLRRLFSRTQGALVAPDQANRAAPLPTLVSV